MGCPDGWVVWVVAAGICWLSLLLSKFLAWFAHIFFGTAPEYNTYVNLWNRKNTNNYALVVCGIIKQLRAATRKILSELLLVSISLIQHRPVPVNHPSIYNHVRHGQGVEILPAVRDITIMQTPNSLVDILGRYIRNEMLP